MEVHKYVPTWFQQEQKMMIIVQFLYYEAYTSQSIYLTITERLNLLFKNSSLT